MVTVIDKVTYLPKDTKKSLIDTNELMNQVYRDIIDGIKKKLRRIDTGGKSATVTITGSVKKGNNDISFNVNSEDANLAEKIHAALK